MYKPNSLWTWMFIVVALVQAIVALGFEGYVFAKFQTELDKVAEENVEALVVPTLLALFIFGFIYEVLLVYDALRLKNTIQVIGLCFCNLGLLVYAAVQIESIKDNTTSLKYKVKPEDGGVRPINDFWEDIRPFLTAIPCVLAVGTVAMSFIAWKLYHEFAWTIYKHISADLRMKRRYLAFQIYIALLKFDFLFFLGFTVQFVIMLINNDPNDYEFGITIAAIPVTILILVLAGFFTRRENRIGMVAIITLYFAGLAYFLFKLIRMYQGSEERKYEHLRQNLTTFAVITVILIVLTIVNACVCMHNFGRGLMPHIAKRRVDAEEEKVSMTEMPSYSSQRPMPSRMVID
ncbi:MAG: hypothetical protein M1823_002329 [Watsoniomyces obsoletus]|nr:MAG: hypothetical protein M1823_002329 [Watsoniomyces obsoletus]